MKESNEKTKPSALNTADPFLIKSTLLHRRSTEPTPNPEDPAPGPAVGPPSTSASGAGDGGCFSSSKPLGFDMSELVGILDCGVRKLGIEQNWNEVKVREG